MWVKTAVPVNGGIWYAATLLTHRDGYPTAIARGLRDGALGLQSDLNTTYGIELASQTKTLEATLERHRFIEFQGLFPVGPFKDTAPAESRVSVATDHHENRIRE